MAIIYSTQAKEDLYYWKKTSAKVSRKIDELLVAIAINPYQGIGKPEKLRCEWSGYYSRRINSEHRLVYKIFADDIYVVQCCYHYD